MEGIAYCINMFQRICEYAWVKFLASSGLVFLSFFFDALQKEAMLAVLILILFDFITGLEAAIKTKTAIKSSKIFRSAVKVAMYFLLISAGFMAEKAVPLISMIDETIISFLAVTELISILENTSKSGYAIPTALVEKLKKISNKYVA